MRLATRSSAKLAVLAGAICVALSVLAWLGAAYWEDQAARAAFETDAAQRFLILTVCLSLAGLGTLYVRSNRRYIRQIERLGQRLTTIFDNVQVMIWDEDFSDVWTALELYRAQGMQDLRQHLRSNPEELQLLEAKVRVNAVNAAALRVLGADRPAGGMMLAAPELDGVFIEKVIGIFDRLDEVNLETSLRCPDGETRMGLLTMTVPRNRDDASHVIVSLFDVTDRKTAEARVAYLAHHDVVTGLPNRAMFRDALNEFLERENRGAKPFAVHYIDIDHFKDINDTLGHPVGDELLKEIGARLGQMTRATDVVARLGGDEFAVLQADVEAPGVVASFAEKLRGMIAQPFMVDGRQIMTTASIGVALCDEATEDAASIMRHADLALYRAKAEGRNTYSFHTVELERSVRERVELGLELRSAIGAGELFLEYQPQVDAARKTIIGFEALVRWRNPTRGLVPPSTIIPVAETTGLIVELGTWVLRETLRQGKAWLDAGYPPTILAVNLSGVEMRASDFETVVLREIEASGYPPHLLELEITESVFFETSRIHHDALKQLRDAGVRFAIDDFGTGYSSLEYLLRFRVDRLKIAQTFMRDVTTDLIAAVIVRAAIGLARDLGIEVMAEGAETAEQVAFLRREDCPQVQGYYFSRPLAAADAEKLLRQGARASDLSRAA